MIGSPSWDDRQAGPQSSARPLGWGRRFLAGAGGLLRGEPLVGFTLAGGLVFALYAGLGTPERETIVIPAEVVAEMVSLRSEILGRPIDAAEQAQLVDDRLLDEILVREAVLRDLHLSDSYVRRRLAQRMKFLLDEEAPPPSEADLERLYQEHPERFQTPRAVSFDQVFFVQDEAAAEAMLPELRRDPSAFEGAGEPFWVGQEFERYTDDQAIAVFGRGFVDALIGLPADGWHGPVRSRRGWHLVRLRELHPSVPLPPAYMQQRLREEWAHRFWVESRQRQLEGLRVNYEVVTPGDAAP